MPRWALSFIAIQGSVALFTATVVSVVIPVALGQETYDPNLHGLLALTEGTGFVQIPAGEFIMGSDGGNTDELPVHRVRISQPFEMGKFEVTQSQWEAVLRRAHLTSGKSRSSEKEMESPENPSHFKGPNLPVDSVSRQAVQEFIRLLNARDSAHQYRLPTEAEWEYACRAGSTPDSPGNLDETAWHEANSDGQTQPVGKKKPNAWGLYDMHGNVWEWVQDWYAPDYYERSPDTDPPGPATGSYRVYRGGSWSRSATDIRSAIRGFDFPHTGYYNVGFRLVRTAK